MKPQRGGEMREWRDKDFPLPSDPGPIHGAILKVWYSIEDWWHFLWCSLDRMDKTTLAMGAIALAIMWIIIVLAPSLDHPNSVR